MREDGHRSVRHHSSLPRGGVRVFAFSLQSMLRYYSLKEGAENVILRVASNKRFRSTSEVGRVSADGRRQLSDKLMALNAWI